MSPRLKIENSKGEVLFDATSRDYRGARFDGNSENPGSMLVGRSRMVTVRSPLLDSAYDVVSGDALRGVLRFRLAAEGTNMMPLITRTDEVRSLTVTAEPVGKARGVERG